MFSANIKDFKVAMNDKMEPDLNTATCTGKLKTNKGAAKRLRATKSGLLKKRNAGRQHILGKKSRKRKRQLRKDGYLSSVDAATSTARDFSQSVLPNANCTTG